MALRLRGRSLWFHDKTAIRVGETIASVAVEPINLPGRAQEQPEP